MTKPHRQSRGEEGQLSIRAGLALMLIGALVLPVVGVVLQLVRGWGRPQTGPASETPLFVWSSLLSTAAYPLLIAGLATILAMPAAWAMRRAAAWWVGLLAVPLLLPSYLAYAAWGMLRGPGSWVGDWLAHGSPTRSLVFDKMLAVFGLAMWAWPIAAFVIGAAARRVPQHLLDALDLEPAGRLRKWRVIAEMLGGSIAASVGLIGVVMAGSAVPLNLAQIDTLSIHLWMYLNATSDQSTIWPVALPLVGAAGAIAAALLRLLGHQWMPVADEGIADGRTLVLTQLLAAAVWVLSVIVPLGLFLANLRQVASIVAFWRGDGAAIWASCRNAGVVGVGVVLITLGVWAVKSCGERRRTARVTVWAWLTGAFTPGVIIGVATVAFWNMPQLPRAAGDSMWPVVLAHIARFGFVGAMAGWWLASQETPDERGARFILAGKGIRAWLTLCVGPQIGAVIGVGLAAAALSLHEIESTVALQPPGPTSLAQYMLEKLHYNRNEELCAACINVMGLGLVLAIAAGWLLGRAAERRTVRGVSG